MALSSALNGRELRNVLHDGPQLNQHFWLHSRTQKMNDVAPYLSLINQKGKVKYGWIFDTANALSEFDQQKRACQIYLIRKMPYLNLINQNCMSYKDKCLVVSS